MSTEQSERMRLADELVQRLRDFNDAPYDAAAGLMARQILRNEVLPEIERLRAQLRADEAEIAELRNDLADALDCKRGSGPTALSMAIARAERAEAEIAELLDRVAGLLELSQKDSTSLRHLCGHRDEWKCRAERAESELAALREQNKELRQSEMGAFTLIADIRAAAGDPTGKLMQPELIARIASDHALRERVAKAPFTFGGQTGTVLARDDSLALHRVRLLIDDEQEGSDEQSQ